MHSDAIREELEKIERSLPSNSDKITLSFAHNAFSSLRSIFDSLLTVSGVDADQAKESPPRIPPPNAGTLYCLQYANLWLTYGNLASLEGPEPIRRAGRETTEQSIKTIIAFLGSALPN